MIGIFSPIAEFDFGSHFTRNLSPRLIRIGGPSGGKKNPKFKPCMMDSEIKDNN